jgi:hypothetical protein
VPPVATTQPNPLAHKHCFIFASVLPSRGTVGAGTASRAPFAGARNNASRPNDKEPIIVMAELSSRVRVACSAYTGLTLIKIRSC